MKHIISSIAKWVCKHFGHKYDQVDSLVAVIKLNALNANNLKHEIVCQRCLEIIKPMSDEKG